MPSEPDVKVEARSWLDASTGADIGTLNRVQSEKLLTALYAAGAETVWVVNPFHGFGKYPFADTLHIKAGFDTVARVMARLANFHPEKTELLKYEPGWHLIRAWWD